MTYEVVQKTLTFLNT